MYPVTTSMSNTVMCQAMMLDLEKYIQVNDLFIFELLDLPDRKG